MVEYIQERCSYTLGFKTVIERPIVNQGIKYSKLKYQSNVIKGLGIKTNFNNETEIDKLLRL